MQDERTGNTGKRISTVIKMADENLKNKRYSICKACPFNEQRKIIGEVCNKCGCIIKAKVAFLYSSCPLQKW